MKLISRMLKAFYAQGSKDAAREKARQVAASLREMRLNEAAKKLEAGIEETLTYMTFPDEHWTRIRTTNMIERMNREIKRRTKVVGTFPDGNSALIWCRHSGKLIGLEVRTKGWTPSLLCF